MPLAGISRDEAALMLSVNPHLVDERAGISPRGACGGASKANSAVAEQ
jgi:hypothetical protein